MLGNSVFIFYDQYLGFAELRSTDGFLINDGTANICSKYIQYALISLNPYTNLYVNETHLRLTMVHEIGHVLGLGHPNTYYEITQDPSVMRQSSFGGYYTPRPHDISDLDRKY